MFGNTPARPPRSVGATVDRRPYSDATLGPNASDDRPGGSPGPDASPGPLLRALSVRRKASVGTVAGVAVGVLAHLLFVVVRGQPVGLAASYAVRSS
ncbi:hypothetical protein BRD13_06390 [Halobacteriales archaeon SW_5_70_135]|nr:MAG: hypothetical protein BRD13_06390 [Halobacteriales archaeon SW_5_70_135]